MVIHKITRREASLRVRVTQSPKISYADATKQQNPAPSASSHVPPPLTPPSRPPPSSRPPQSSHPSPSRPPSSLPPPNSISSPSTPPQPIPLLAPIITVADIHPPALLPLPL